MFITKKQVIIVNNHYNRIGRYYPSMHMTGKLMPERRFFNKNFKRVSIFFQVLNSFNFYSGIS